VTLRPSDVRMPNVEQDKVALRALLVCGGTPLLLSACLAAQVLSRAGWSMARLRSLAYDGSANGDDALGGGAVRAALRATPLTSRVLILHGVVCFPLVLAVGIGVACRLAFPAPLGADVLWLAALQTPAVLVGAATLLRARTLDYRFSSRDRSTLGLCAASAAAAQLMLALTPPGGHDASGFREASAAMLGINLAPVIVGVRLLAPKPWRPAPTPHAIEELSADEGPPSTPEGGTAPPGGLATTAASSTAVPHPPPLAAAAACACAYVLSLGAYAAAGPSIAPLHPLATPLAAAAVLALDTLVLLYARARVLASSGAALRLCAATRLALSVCGEAHVSVAEAALFLAHGVALARHGVRARHPPPPTQLKAYVTELVQARRREAEEGVGVSAGQGGDTGAPDDAAGGGHPRGGLGVWRRRWLARLSRADADAEAPLLYLCAGHALALFTLSALSLPPLALGACLVPQQALGVLAPAAVLAVGCETRSPLTHTNLRPFEPVPLFYCPGARYPP